VAGTVVDKHLSEDGWNGLQELSSRKVVLLYNSVQCTFSVHLPDMHPNDDLSTAPT
jgi:hypothetical protein